MIFDPPIVWLWFVQSDNDRLNEETDFYQEIILSQINPFEKIIKKILKTSSLIHFQNKIMVSMKNP